MMMYIIAFQRVESNRSQQQGGRQFLHGLQEHQHPGDNEAVTDEGERDAPPGLPDAESQSPGHLFKVRRDLLKRGLERLKKKKKKVDDVGDHQDDCGSIKEGKKFEK